MSEGDMNDFFEKELDEEEADDENCPACDVAPGELHAVGCDIEQCPYCGCQLISCLCPASERGVPDDDRMPWSGTWPGEAECREFGWYAKLVKGKGWIPCRPDEPGAGPDLNRLHDPNEARWDRENKRFVRLARG